MGQQTDSAATSKLAEARALVLAEKKARADACWAELQPVMQAILEKHRCDLDLIPASVGSVGSFPISAQIRISARED